MCIAVLMVKLQMKLYISWIINNFILMLLCCYLIGISIKEA